MVIIHLRYLPLETRYTWTIIQLIIRHLKIMHWRILHLKKFCLEASYICTWDSLYTRDILLVSIIHLNHTRNEISYTWNILQLNHLTLETLYTWNIIHLKIQHLKIILWRILHLKKSCLGASYTCDIRHLKDSPLEIFYTWNSLH